MINFNKKELTSHKEVIHKSANSVNTIQVFKNLYYHLYSNSNSSRAERIFEDIAKLLLIKIISEKSRNEKKINSFLEKKGSANRTLLPLLTQRFPDLIRKHDLFSLSDNQIIDGFNVLNDITLTQSSAAVLGDAFQVLIGPGLRGDKGQFFTPRELIKAMVRIANPKSGDKIVDPASGTGGFLVESFVHIKKNESKPEKNIGLLGLEKDEDIQRLGGAMLEIATDGCGQISLTNSFDINEISKLSPSPFNADIVLTNPPFGSRIGVKDREILKQYDLGREWIFDQNNERWIQQESLRVSQDPQILFLELGIKLLKPGGLLGIILPEGMFGNKKSGYVWDFVLKNCEIEVLIDCPRTTFQPDTDTKTNVVFIRKNKHKNSSQTWISVAKNVGHDRRGRKFSTKGISIANDFEIIGSSYKTKNSKWWSKCTLSNRYYLIPRYYYGKNSSELSALITQPEGKSRLFNELISNGDIIIRKGVEIGAEYYGTGKIPFVRTSDITNWEISVNPTNGVSTEVYEQYKSKQKLKPGDILLVVDGRYKIGKTAILHNYNCKCLIQSHFLIITTTPSSPINNYELLYILNLPQVLEQIRNLVFIQSTLASIGNRVRELIIPLPKKTPKWKSTIREFRESIETRARLLDQLKFLESNEFDV